LNAIDILLPEKAISIDVPSTILTTLNEQANQNRKVVHFPALHSRTTGVM
jgi:hypothetical protein